MKLDFSDVTVVLDRSGSMQSCRTDAEGGVNAFIEEQKKHPGECAFSLVEFDTEYNFVHKAKPVAEVPPYTLVPRGGTALLDAVGRAINETGERLAAMKEEDRPSLVVFVIVTDGEENESKEFSRSQIKAMIERQQKDYNWQFTFLGANQDAFAEAGAIGIAPASVGLYHRDKTSIAFAAASSNVSRMRTASASGQEVDNSYTSEEVKSLS